MNESKRSSRGALAVFGVLALAAIPFYLVLGRKEWFFLDEWDFLAARTAGNLGDLLRPHVNHWTTLPILACTRCGRCSACGRICRTNCSRCSRTSRWRHCSAP